MRRPTLLGWFVGFVFVLLASAVIFLVYQHFLGLW